MTKIQTVSRRFRRLFQIMFFLMPVVLLGFVVFVIAAPLPSVIHVFKVAEYAMNPSRAMLALAVLMSYLPMLAFLLGLHQMIRLLRNYEQSRIFCLENIKLYRGLAWTIVLWVILDVLSQNLTVLMVTLNNPVGYRMFFAWYVGSYPTALVISGIIMLVSWVMAEAQKISDENAHTI